MGGGGGPRPLVGRETQEGLPCAPHLIWAAGVIMFCSLQGKELDFGRYFPLLKTYDLIGLFFFNANKRLFVCKQNIVTRCVWGRGGSCFLPGDLQINGRDRKGSESQPAFLGGAGFGTEGPSWFPLCCPF